MTEPEPSKFQGRRLSSIEQYYFERTLAKLYSSFFVAAVYVGLTPALLSQALRNLVLKEQIFAYQIAGKTAEELEVEVLDLVRFDDVVTFIDRPDLKEAKIDESVVKEVLSQFLEFETGKPLWNLWVVNNETVIFFCNHILYDGTSGANFHKLLLRELNKLDQNHSLDLVEVLFDSNKDARPLVYVPDHDKYTNPDLYTIFWTLYEEFMPVSVKRFFDYWNFKKDPQDLRLVGEIFKSQHKLKVGEFDIASHLVHVPPEKLQELLRISRENKVRLTSLVIYLLLMALSLVTKNRDIAIDIPINTRKSFEQPDDAVGLYANLASLQIPALESPRKLNWEEIATIQRKLAKEVSSEYNLKRMGVLQYVDIKKFATSRVGEACPFTVEFSNLGALREAPTDKVRITNMFFNQCIGLNAGLFNANAISTPEGGMNIFITHFRDETELLADSVEFFKEAITNIGDYL